MTDTHYPQTEFDPESADRYELHGDTEPSIAVIEAVAETVGCDPLDLDPLGAYVNCLGVKWFETRSVSSSRKIRDLPNDPEACQWTPVLPE